jgi:hypothetical protein
MALTPSLAQIGVLNFFAGWVIPPISARAYWSAHHAVSVPTTIGADDTIASIACAFMQVMLYRERSRTP